MKRPNVQTFKAPDLFLRWRPWPAARSAMLGDITQGDFCRRHTFGRLAILAAIFIMTCAADADTPLSVDRAEFGPHERLTITVQPPAEVSPRSSLRVGWMEPGGERLHPSLVRVQRGPVDLAEIFPDLREHREISFVQLFVNGRPTGPAVTVQPMLEPLVPMTVDGYRWDGSVFPRVVGWRTQRELAEMAQEEKVDDDGDQDEENQGDESPAEEEKRDPESMPEIDRGRPAAEALADPSRERRGYRLYVERDVMIETSLGTIRIKLRPDHAPETIWNFRELVRRGFFDGLTFHRILPMTAAGEPFIIQAGDPTGKGHGGPGYEVHLEPSEIAHDFGVISMARRDEPDSAGSQFFISLSRAGTASLDGQYCSFGYAVAGRETILAIADEPLEDVQRGHPKQPVVIHAARLIDAPPRRTGHGRTDARVQRELPEDDEPRPPGRVPR